MPTLHEGAWVRVDRLAYRRSMPRRFDVVLIEHPHRSGFWEVKRVIGLPGERIEIVDGMLMVDGVEVRDMVQFQDERSYDWQLGEGQYVVLGDNRQHSTDSRAFGLLQTCHIVGRVVLRQ